MLLCLLLAGCGWDMHYKVWEKAEQMCAPFGGLLGADWRRGAFDGERRIFAYCKNGQTVEQFFEDEEMRWKE